MSLIVDGTLSLDTTVRSVLGPDLPEIADDVTVEHLLAHRSGIGDYLDEENEDLDPVDYVLVSPVHVLAATEAFVSEVDGYPTKFVQPPTDPTTRSALHPTFVPSCTSIRDKSRRR